MPKMKTHSGAAKRFKQTGSGKFRRNRAYGSHILTKKSAKRKRLAKQTATVEACHNKALKDLLPYGA